MGELWQFFEYKIHCICKDPPNFKMCVKLVHMIADTSRLSLSRPHRVTVQWAMCRVWGHSEYCELCGLSLSYRASSSSPHSDWTFITSALRGSYASIGICPSVCLFVCEQHNSKNLSLDFLQICTHCPHMPKQKADKILEMKMSLLSILRPP